MTETDAGMEKTNTGEKTNEAEPEIEARTETEAGKRKTKPEVEDLHRLWGKDKDLER